jgi:hypothetical protein
VSISKKCLSMNYCHIDEMISVKMVYDLLYKSTNDSIDLTMTGTDVKANVMIPNKLILRLDSAAARGSETNKTAVAIAEEFPPRVTPRVT